MNSANEQRCIRREEKHLPRQLLRSSLDLVVEGEGEKLAHVIHIWKKARRVIRRNSDAPDIQVPP